MDSIQIARRLKHLARAVMIGVYVYAAPALDTADWYCRNYALVVGIWEDDAATGTSAAALTGVLREISGAELTLSDNCILPGGSGGASVAYRDAVAWRGTLGWRTCDNS